MLLYKAREAVVKLFNGYSTIASAAKYKTIHGKGLPSDLATCLIILTPKQMPQRWLTAFAKLKTGNTSEKLLNEIGQIIYLLYRKNDINKKTI